MRHGIQVLSGLESVRRATEAAHRDVEALTRLPASLCDRNDLTGFLRRWTRLAATLEPIAEPWLSADRPSVRLAHDLRTLGAETPAEAVSAVAQPVDAEPSDPRRLGVAWVLLGASLGLRSMRAHVCDLVEHDLATFGPPAATALRRVRTAIDEIPDDATIAAVSDAALGAFGIAADILGGPPWNR